MRDDGCDSLLVTHHGPFRARLTRIALHRLRLQSAQESSARIAFFSIPADSTLIFIPIGRTLSPIWGGTKASAGELIIVGAGHRAHARSSTGGRWGTLIVPAGFLESYARTLTGTALVLPSGVSLWRPSIDACRRLIRLYVSATGVANARAAVITASEAARGLEHDLMGAIVSCLCERQPEPRRSAADRHSDVMARFEDLLRAQPHLPWTAPALSEALELSGRLFRMCCDEHLGMGSQTYMRLRRMQLVRRALRQADPSVTTVAELAAEYGFSDAGRFSGAYRANFGEFPAITLRRAVG